MTTHVLDGNHLTRDPRLVAAAVVAWGQQWDPDQNNPTVVPKVVITDDEDNVIYWLDLDQAEALIERIKEAITKSQTMKTLRRPASVDRHLQALDN